MKQEHKVGSAVFDIMKKQKLLCLGIIVTVCGTVVFALIPPLILAKIIDTVTAGRGVGFFAVLLYFGVLALTGILESCREGLLVVFGQKITHGLRSTMMDKFLHLTTANISSQEPGTLVSRFVGDVDTVENLFTSGIISMFADACKIVSIMTVIWFQNRGLAVVLLLVLPVVFLFTRQVQKKMLAAQIKNRKAIGRASGHVPETLHNIRTIQNLGKEAYMEQRYDAYINESYQAMEKTNFYDAVYSPVILILNAVVVAVVMLLSASGDQTVQMFFGMTAGTAVAVINYISQIFAPVESLGMEIQTIQSAAAGIHRINEFLSMEEKQTVAECPMEKKEKRKTSPFVEFQDVVFGYDEHVVLDHLSFSIEEGEQTALSGRTGIGKSTILKLVLGLYEPQEGNVWIQGIPASQIPEQEKRRLFGYVEQSFHMVPGTVRDQITLFDETITEEDIKKAVELTGLEKAICGLENGYNTKCTPELFSQGQWQLLSIARATVAKPKLLLLDEITANLDAETEKSVLQALANASKDRTVISVSHRISADTTDFISAISLQNIRSDSR